MQAPFLVKVPSIEPLVDQLVDSTYLKNISQIGSFPQVGVEK